MRRRERIPWRFAGTVLLAFLGGCFHSGKTERCPFPPVPGGSERTWTSTSTAGVIEGRLEEFVTRSPLKDVGVTLVGQGSRTTGSNGEFRFTGVAPGSHMVWVLGRYPVIRDTIVVKPGAGMRGLLRLEPSHAEIDCIISVQ
jgi:hypothetical protein